MKILAAWIGTQDLRASAEPGASQGPIANVLQDQRFDRALLLANQDPTTVNRYIAWLHSRVSTKVECRHVELNDPTDHEAIYEIVCKAIDEANKSAEGVVDWTFHLSPGTPAMSNVWCVLSGTKYPANLVQSSIEHGVKAVRFPFVMAAEYAPAKLKLADSRLRGVSPGLQPETYGEFQFRSASMKRLFRKAQKAMPRSFPLVIEGEPGTEKELLARTIHSNGPRRSNSFVAVDCAATPPEQIEAALFGADGNAGAWARAEGGTLFIDNAERLPSSSQRLLQTRIELDQRKERVAARSAFDVRVIVASSTSLLGAVAEGRFLEPVFFSLATLVLKIPPLRDRQGDIILLLDRILQKVNEQSVGEPDFAPRKLSPGAKNVLQQHSWPGNLRELESTVRRAAIVADAETISEADAIEALLPTGKRTRNAADVTGKPIEDGVDLQAIMAQVARDYLTRALEVAEGNKTEAAQLLSLPSYQTLSNWMKKYEVE